MNIGKATAIFKDIHNEETEVEDKITAIQEVIDMPTHNSITKKSMLEVLHWLIEEYIQGGHMNIAQRAEICKHSTGHIGAVAVYTRPTCPNMHIIKGKYVTARTNCKECRFYEERK